MLKINNLKKLRQTREIHNLKKLPQKKNIKRSIVTKRANSGSICRKPAPHHLRVSGPQSLQTIIRIITWGVRDARHVMR